MLASFNNFNKIPFASRKIQKTNPQGDVFYLEEGKAYDKNGKPYSGTLKEKTKDEDEFILSYEDGRIKTSEKNGKLYKTYYYNSDDGCRNHYFKDKSFLTYQQMYHCYEKDIVQIRNYENKTRHYIMKNDKNGFKNEPKVQCHLTTELRSRKIIDEKTVQLNGFENAEFDSVEEAKEYFLEKYGINADFNDLKTAYIIKQAVDIFTPLNYKNKGEKIFEGLKIKNDYLNRNEFGKVFSHFEIDGKRLNQDTATQEEIKEFNKKIDKYIKENSKNIKVVDSYIVITNSNIANTKLRNSYNDGFHPTKFLSGLVVHEFVHYLHATENPNWYAINANKSLTNEQLKIAKQVGGYSCSDIAEFVAEYAAGRLEGRTFSKEADELYKEFKGPELFEN